MLLNPKIVFISTAQMFIVSFLLSYFRLEIPLGNVVSWLNLQSFHLQTQKGPAPEPSNKRPAVAIVIMTTKELASFNGKKGSKGLYLAILGKIFDVQKGNKHYGPKGSYHFFAGRDATRAFVTGEFNEEGLRDDITDLSHQDLLGIEEWLGFYDKEYKFIGYLQGTYYDSKGRPTDKLVQVRDALKIAHKWRANQKAETERFPPCNSEWSQGKGGRVWCSTKSGGISRDWVGVPRKLFMPGSSQSRCACVKNFGPPQDQSSTESYNNRGDLDNPNLQEYPRCNSNAISCKLPSK